MTNTARRARQPRGWGGRDATQAQSYISVYVYTYIYIYIYILSIYFYYTPLKSKLLVGGLGVLRL